LKLLNYTLVGVLGAAFASLATYRLLDGGGPATATPGSPIVVREFVPAPPPPPAPTGPSAAEWEELTRKNADLSAQLAEERARREKADLTLTKTREDLEELRRPMTADLLSSSLRAQMKSGEVVVTGGYQLPDGTRLYAFVQPTVERVDGADVVNIASTFRMLADEAGKTVGLDKLATNAANTLQHGEVWMAEEKQAVLGALETTPGMRGITYPGVKLRMGASSVIEVGELRLKVTPTLGANPESLNFEVRLEQPQTPGLESTPAQSPGR
jgi:hypothetical protein